MSPAQKALNGDVALAWEELGDGEPVLLIHGLGYDRHGWGSAAARLAERWRVIVFDNRGIGESDKPAADAYQVADMADDARAVLDAAGVGRAHIVGTSLGGMIGQELALSTPERVDRLVLVATHVGLPEAFPVPEVTAAAFAAFAADPSDATLRRLVENALADETVAARHDIVEALFAYRLAHRPEAAPWAAQAAAASAFTSARRVHRISAPTLVLQGRSDNVVDPRNAALIADRVPGARLELVPGVGHLMFWDAPELFVEVVRDFLGAGK